MAVSINLKNLIDRARNNDKEAYDELVNKYYYYVLEKCMKYDDSLKEKAIYEANKILTNTILEFVTNPKYNNNYSISSLLYLRFRYLDGKVFPRKKTNLQKLEKKAFDGSIEAKKKVFNKYKYIFDSAALVVYNNYKLILNNYFISRNDYSYFDDKCSLNINYISLDDIKQELYYKGFDLINRYYASNNNSQIISTYLSTSMYKQIDILTKKIAALFNYDLSNYSFDIPYIDQGYDEVITYDIIDRINNYIHPQYREMIKLLMDDYTHREACDKLGVSRGMIQSLRLHIDDVIKNKKMSIK